MSEWKEYKLGELVEDKKANLQTGPFGTMLNASEYSKEGVPVIAVQDIGDNKLVYHKFVFVSQEVAERLKRYRVEENDIIFGRKGATDRRALIKKCEEGWLQGSDCIRLRFDNTINAKFVSYQLATKKDWMSQYSTGATMPSLNQEILKLLPINLPSYRYQSEISETLSSLDDKIDLLHRQSKTLEQLAETLFRHWFVEEVDKGWSEVTVNSIAKIQSGYAFKSADFIELGTYKIITIKSVQDGFLDTDRADMINIIPNGMPEYCLLKEGDILLSLTGNVGRCCLVDENNLLLNQRVAKLKPIFSRDWAFIYIMFRQTSMRRILEELAKGTAQANLSPIETGQMEIHLPPTERLERFSIEATPLIQKILQNKKQIRTLSQMRDTLLPKLMSGDVKIKI